jgi:hypothetical protein
MIQPFPGLGLLKYEIAQSDDGGTGVGVGVPETEIHQLRVAVPESSVKAY